MGENGGEHRRSLPAVGRSLRDSLQSQGEETCETRRSLALLWRRSRLWGLTAACDNEPKPIVGPSPNAQPVATLVVSVEISGPASIPPGQSAQFTAISRLSDGTSQTATSVRWSSHTRLVQVDASGLVTAGQRTGEDICPRR